LGRTVREIDPALFPQSIDLMHMALHNIRNEGLHHLEMNLVGVNTTSIRVTDVCMGIRSVSNEKTEDLYPISMLNNSKPMHFVTSAQTAAAGSAPGGEKMFASGGRRGRHGT
jgi:hypothetical protein